MGSFCFVFEFLRVYLNQTDNTAQEQDLRCLPHHGSLPSLRLWVSPGKMSITRGLRPDRHCSPVGPSRWALLSGSAPQLFTAGREQVRETAIKAGPTFLEGSFLFTQRLRGNVGDGAHRPFGVGAAQDSAPRNRPAQATSGTASVLSTCAGMSFSCPKPTSGQEVRPQFSTCTRDPATSRPVTLPCPIPARQ